ncbi:hypothetical protein [Ruegeria lacuscaerulensis]|uniref:hypothetical protein n=1 Tax=Ruegeria lacuscaerulensis TaxID=55218 RepID=UPI0014818FDB|nr:hypothetical protein [Ruegeria lacuscaerulensis]
MKPPAFLMAPILGLISTPAFAAGGDPRWWVAPNQTDTYAWVGLIVLALAILLVVHLYARFERYTEHKSIGTPLRTTIPTMLTVALAYELMPALSHFSSLLPGALILTAIARDFMLWWRPSKEEMVK